MLKRKRNDLTDVTRFVVFSAVTYIHQVRAFETIKAPSTKVKAARF